MLSTSATARHPEARHSEAYRASPPAETRESQASAEAPTQSAPRPSFDSPPPLQRSAATARPAIALAHEAVTSRICAEHDVDLLSRSYGLSGRHTQSSCSA